LELGSLALYACNFVRSVRSRTLLRKQDIRND
jgi:hypothetical protein